jgi:hypothetical protein
MSNPLPTLGHSALEAEMCPGPVAASCTVLTQGLTASAWSALWITSAEV